MGKKKVIEEEKPVESEATESAASSEGEGSEKATVSAWAVMGRGGKYIRTYSIEVHGERAEALANQFAGKVGGKVEAAS